MSLPGYGSQKPVYFKHDTDYLGVSGLNEISNNILLSLLVRFVLNVPVEDRSSWPRLLYHVQEAYYYYCDGSADAFNEASSEVDVSAGETSVTLQKSCPPQLGSTSVETLHSQVPFPYFARSLLGLLPTISTDHITYGLSQFLKYNQSITVCGVVLLDRSKTHVLTVCAHASSPWVFPKGKRAAGETEYLCALREAKEEIGSDVSGFLSKSPLVRRSSRQGRAPVVLFGGVGPWDSSTIALFYPQCIGEIHEIKWQSINKIKQAYVKLVRNMRNERLGLASDSTKDSGTLDSSETTSSRLDWIVSYYPTISALVAAEKDKKM